MIIQSIKGGLRCFRTMNDIFEKVKSLNIPIGSYTVIGSGSMSAHGIRPHNDIDMLVTQEVFSEFKEKGWKLVKHNENFEVLEKDDFEMSVTMNIFGDYNPDIKESIETSEIINGVAFASLKDTMDFKKSLGREKDLKDIELIKKYLDDK